MRVSSRSVPNRKTSTKCHRYIEADHRSPVRRARVMDTGDRSRRGIRDLYYQVDGPPGEPSCQSKPHSAQTGLSGCHRMTGRYLVQEVVHPGGSRAGSRAAAQACR